jgi:hypothetical protein
MKFLALILVIFTIPEAFACRDPLSETHTFFKELPPSLGSKEVVAKIKVVSTEISKDQAKIVTARIVSAIKGVKVGDVVKIVSDVSSCNRDPDVRSNDEYYVAGTLSSAGFLRGVWQQRDLIKQN